jgi:hypothetical protein
MTTPAAHARAARTGVGRAARACAYAHRRWSSRRTKNPSAPTARHAPHPAHPHCTAGHGAGYGSRAERCRRGSDLPSDPYTHRRILNRFPYRP